MCLQPNPCRIAAEFLAKGCLPCKQPLDPQITQIAQIFRMEHGLGGLIWSPESFPAFLFLCAFAVNSPFLQESYQC